MIKTAVLAMAWLMATGLAFGTPLPVGTYRHAELKPENRITLQNGVTTTILSIPGLDRGIWLVSFYCTFQDTVNPNGPLSVNRNLPVPLEIREIMNLLPYGTDSGSYLYKVAALSYNHAFPGNGFNAPDARPYMTWWFGMTGTRALIFDADPQAYLVVESYGQVSPFSTQAFAYMWALKIGQFP